MEKIKQTKEDLVKRIDILVKDNEVLIKENTSLKHSIGGLTTARARTQKKLDEANERIAVLELELKKKHKAINEQSQRLISNKAQIEAQEKAYERVKAELDSWKDKFQVLRDLPWYKRILFALYINKA